MTEIGAVASANTNLSAGGAVSADLSFSLYPGKNGATDVQSVDMSFGDFLDMINPLQHIPVISSIYRAVTGENINPVSRIAGDVMYGGAMGLASAGLAALGSIGDEVLTAANGGQSTGEVIVASLFGDDGTPDAQIASVDNSTGANAAPSTSQIQLAGLQTPAPQQSPILGIPDLSATSPQDDAAQAVATANTPSKTANPAADKDAADKAMPLDRSKMPYGGVMDTAMMQNAQQNQALALAMAGAAGNLQAQHNLRNSRFATANTVNPALSGSPTNPMTSATMQAPAAPQTQAALQNLIAELQAAKGINQYKNAAQSSPTPGSTVNVTN